MKKNKRFKENRSNYMWIGLGVIIIVGIIITYNIW